MIAMTAKIRETKVILFGIRYFLLFIFNILKCIKSMELIMINYLMRASRYNINIQINFYLDYIILSSGFQDKLFYFFVPSIKGYPSGF